MMAAWGVTLDGWVWMAVWVLALLVMVWMLVGGQHRPSPADDAAAILRARFARGEINEAEFERARRVLEDDQETKR